MLNPQEIVDFIYTSEPQSKIHRKKLTSQLQQKGENVIFDDTKEVILNGIPIIDSFDQSTKSFIQSIHLQIGEEVCNYRCSFCGQQRKNNQNKSHFFILDDIAKFIINNNIKKIRIQGGEPTIIPEVRDFVASLESSNCFIDLMTNGYCFDPFWQNALAQRGNEVNISLNAASEQLYSDICRDNSFKTVLKNIRDFVVLKNNFDGPKCLLSLSMVVYEKTWPEVISFVLLAKELGADAIRLNVYLDYEDWHSGKYSQTDESIIKNRKYFEEFILSEAARYVTRDSILGLAKSVGLAYCPTNDSVPPTPRYTGYYHPYKVCNIPWTQIFINNGRVSSCCFSKYIFGNMLYEPLEEIIDNIPAQLLRTQLLCDDYRNCRNICDPYMFLHNNK